MSAAPWLVASLLVAGFLTADLVKGAESPPASTAKTSARFQPIEELLSAGIADKAYPGCAVIIGTSREVLYSRGFGRFEYDRGSAVTPETLYDLASLTKVVGTTSVVLTLVRDEKLRLSDSVGKFIPEFVTAAASPEEQSRRQLVTVEHLLTHSSGLPAWKRLDRTAENYQEAIAAVVATPLETEPGTRTRYSDLGMILLGEIAARAGEKPLAELERERVFEPLAMHATLRNPSETLRPRIAPTERRATGGFWQGIVHDENARTGEGLTGHAGLFSTSSDLARWAREWLLALRGSSKIFPRELAEQFTTRRELVTGSSRALGWDTPSSGSSAGTRISRQSFGHTGFTGTSLWIAPTRDLYIILLTNAVHPQRGHGRHFSIRRHLADLASELVPPTNTSQSPPDSP